MKEETNPPTKLWEPAPSDVEKANLTQYMAWLEEEYELRFDDYHALWKWSVDHIDEFWGSVWNYFDINADEPFRTVRTGKDMPGVKWFEGTRINYCEHIFRQFSNERPAIIYGSEDQEPQEMSWKKLASRVSAFRTYLRECGVGEGDRVAAYLPNIPEATIAFLATNSLGAIWTSTSPDFGISSVIDRFAQVEPRILIGVDGYRYSGKTFDRSEHLRQLVENLSSVEKLVVVNRIGLDRKTLPKHTPWEDTLRRDSTPMRYNRVPFSHPMWVLYSSGTTGLPKPITHSHGGMLLEHLKYLTFHNDIQEGDRCFWYTTTGWMMWNYIQACLLCGATIVLYDGSPAYPDMNVLWKFAEKTGITHFGTSAGYITANIKAETHPGQDFDLSELRSIGSTGSPLPPEGFDWCYREISNELWLASISGGTDVCSAFVGGNPLLPVYSGEIQCRALGCKLEALDSDGQPLEDEVGEMVITAPMPCMPVFFWNDPENNRYRESYFEQYPGKWRHGDWTRITPRKGVVIYGRSDATLNRGGVRIGTSEIYRAVDKLPEIRDSLIICLEKGEGDFYMPLFVVLKDEYKLDSKLGDKIKSTLRSEYSPRHVPDEIIAIHEVPYTISGKKVEAPVKKILLGAAPEKAIKKDALRNPGAIDYFVRFRDRM